MNRYLLFTSCFFLTLLIPSIYASANCFITGMIPGQGNIVVCDNNAPNPDPNGVQVGVESTNNNDEITVETGASINNAAGRAISTGLGADLITVYPGTGNIKGSGANISLGTEGSNNTMVVHGGNLSNGILFEDGSGNSVEFGNATINAVFGNGIVFGNGSGNSATIHSGIINGDNNGIFFNNGDNNSVEFSNATITAGNNGIFFNNGANRSLVFHSGTINSDNNAIFFNNGDSTVHINGGTLIPDFGAAISTNDGEDGIVLRGGNINPGNAGQTIITGAANDTVRIERVSSFSGLIDGEEGDGDTLIFAQAIPDSEECSALREQIASLNPADDSITIDGILFTWINFEIIEEELRCPDSIPTMTEWGFIVLVVALGIFGLLAIKRRKVAA
jgi:IPTL-CTERM motif